jgi:hypothetical protein
MPVDYAHRGPLGNFEAGAYRLSEVVQNVMETHGPDVIGKWLAFRLGEPWDEFTGRYAAGPGDTKAEVMAVVAKGHDETHFGYVAIPPQSLSPRGAANYLRFTRQQYENGWRIRTSDRNPNVEAVPVERPGALDLYRPADLILPKGIRP